MKIAPVKFYQPAFKAHYYKIEPKYQDVIIQTDNNPNLGEEPYLLCEQRGDTKKIKMEKEDELYSAKAHFSPTAHNFKYRIQYEDTGAVDLKDGDDYVIDTEKLVSDAAIRVRNVHRQPLIHAINPGKAAGKVLYKDYFGRNETVDEPAIVVTKQLGTFLKNPNIVGLVFVVEDVGTLAHVGAMLRQDTKACGVIFEPDVIEKLKSLDGKNVQIEIQDNKIDIKETDKISSPKVYPKITVPEMKYCDKILASREYSSDIVGAKAVNLRRLEELAEEGKIDVKIPKSIALPYGFIQHMFDENQRQKEKYEKNKDRYECKEAAYAPYEEENNEKRMFDLIKVLDEEGINTKDIMVRSAFNGEDLPNYSAAGIYSSSISKIIPEDLYENICRVAQSKWELDAKLSRKKHGIPDDVIKPSVILQNEVKPDYKYTLYTDCGNGKMRIELFSHNLWLYEGDVQPNVFTYDRKTKELTYDSIQMNREFVTYDENLNVVNPPPHHEKYDLAGNTAFFENMHKLIENALVIEKEFGKPQDIEGGFLKDDIYLWQTRNIPGANASNNKETKFLDSRLTPETLAVKQRYLNNPTPETFNDFAELEFYTSIDSNMRILNHVLGNKIVPLNKPFEEKYSKINECLHLFDKFLEYNPEEKVNKLNPIDMTSVFKTLLSENHCEGIKMKGLECLKDGLMGDNVFDVYYGLAELIKFAQKQTDNKNITLSFEKDDALYATITYKGKKLDEKDFYNAVPSAKSYDCLNPVTADYNGDFASVRLRLNTLDFMLK